MTPSEVVDAIDVALRVARALGDIGAGDDYFVGGSVASSLQGDPRATNDIVVSMSAHRVPAFARALGGDFEVDEEMLREALHRSSCATIFFLPVITKVDIFGVGAGAFDEAEFGRRRRLRVRPTGEELIVKSPEDTVLRKLLWYREGGEVSEKQWRDVVEVLRVSGPTMEKTYLDSWATRLALTDLLARARRDA